MRDFIVDILIVGGGISGTLLAEQLVDRKDMKVSLINRETHVGGRLLTYRGKNGHLLELGAMRIPEGNKHTLSLCKRLGLSLVPFVGGVSQCNSFILQDGGDYSTGYDNAYPYTELLNRGISQFCGLEQLKDIPPEWLYLKMAMKLDALGVAFNQMSLKEWVEIILDRSSQRLFWDLLGYDYLHRDDVSAIACLKKSGHNEHTSQFFQVANGMQTIAHTLAERFVSAGGSLHTGEMVQSIEHFENGFLLKTNLNRNHQCRFLVLAIAPNAILSIHRLKPFLDANQQTALESIGSYSSTKTYAHLPGLRGVSKEQLRSGFFRTNLSIRQGHWSPCGTSVDENLNHMILAEYRNNYDDKRFSLPDDSWKTNWNRISRDLACITNHEIPEPIEIVHHDWGKVQSGIAAHYWRVGESPKATIEQLQGGNANILFVGEAISHHHGWIEGAISSIKTPLQKLRSYT